MTINKNVNVSVEAYCQHNQFKVRPLPLDFPVKRFYSICEEEIAEKTIVNKYQEPKIEVNVSIVIKKLIK